MRAKYAAGGDGGDVIADVLTEVQIVDPDQQSVAPMLCARFCSVCVARWDRLQTVGEVGAFGSTLADVSASIVCVSRRRRRRRQSIQGDVVVERAGSLRYGDFRPFAP